MNIFVAEIEIAIIAVERSLAFGEVARQTRDRRDSLREVSRRLLHSIFANANAPFARV